MALRVIFLWHMHQPFYKDLVTGEYRLPWVRLHALKDYYGMVKLLDEFPDVHQTFNIVPSLIRQIEDYVSGVARDPFLDVAAKPAADLTPDERRFALQYLFQANPTHMIGRYPRYRELWERFRGFGYDPARAETYFSTEEIADLQVLSQIAWFDEFFLDQPEVAELVRKGHNFNLSDQRFVMAHQQGLLAEVMPAYKRAAERGSIEISASPFYHPIMPLLCDSDIGAVSAPGLPLPHKRFRHPEDAREQLRRGLDLHQSVFGIRPRGVWPSEGSVSEEVLHIAHQLGIKWMATDEGVLGRSLNTFFQRSANDRLASGSAQQLYNIYRYERDGTDMHLIFRDHALSDLVGFVYSGVPAAEAAQHLMQHIRSSAEPILQEGHDAIVPIILDGENAWEHYPGSGREFLRRVYDAVARDPEIEGLTVSEAISRHRNFGKLHHLAPGSWINANFNVWIGAPEDNRSWEHLTDAREFFEQAAPAADAGGRELALEELLIAEGSDWNWWYGPEHHSANDREFDELYRKHLSNIYQALGAAPPEALAQPIATLGGRPYFVPQTAYVRPKLYEKTAHYFDWVGAAMYTADRTTSAMHGKRFYLDSLLAGIDESSLYVRLEFRGGVPPSVDESESGFQIALTCESFAPGETEPSQSIRATLQIGTAMGADGKEPAVMNWNITRVNGGPGPRELNQAQYDTQRLQRGARGLSLGQDNERQDNESPLEDESPHRPSVTGKDATPRSTTRVDATGAEMEAPAYVPELRFRLRDALEMQIPFALLHAQTDGKLCLRITMWRQRLPVDALPMEGSMELELRREHELSAAGY
jgi:alpha-amylase/alpha-mannosidase (GH57 family)